MKLSHTQAYWLRRLMAYAVVYPSDGMRENTAASLVRMELAEWAHQQPRWWGLRITDKGRALLRQWDATRASLEMERKQ